MLSNLELFSIYNWSTIGTDAFLVVLFTVCIIKIQKGNKGQFATMISALMVVSNFAGIFVVNSN